MEPTTNNNNNSVSYIQRRIRPHDDQGQSQIQTEDAHHQRNVANSLYALVFQTIAGDAAWRKPSVSSTSANADMKYLQMGIMDIDTIEALAVASLVNPSTTSHAAGTLSDIRMGATHSQLCATCTGNHQN
jgi:hypothetical protein